MNDIVLWGRANSSNVQKAVWALEEAGVVYERRDAGGKFGLLDTPELVAKNPNRLVPILQHGELTLWESHAIVRYVAAQFGGEALWPTDAGKRAIVDQWTDWTLSTFQKGWITLFWLLVRTPAERQDRAAIATALADSVAAFRIMEAQLEKTPYLSGERFGYADIVAGVALYRWTTMEIERPDLPAVEAWHERLLERPAFEKSVCVSYDDLRGRLTF